VAVNSSAVAQEWLTYPLEGSTTCPRMRDAEDRFPGCHDHGAEFKIVAQSSRRSIGWSGARDRAYYAQRPPTTTLCSLCSNTSRKDA